jgi:hypothetical protein
MIDHQKMNRSILRPCKISIAYHYTNGINVNNIRDVGLLSQTERANKGVISNFNGSYLNNIVSHILYNNNYIYLIFQGPFTAMAFMWLTTIYLPHILGTLFLYVWFLSEKNTIMIVLKVVVVLAVVIMIRELLG